MLGLGNRRLFYGIRWAARWKGEWRCQGSVAKQRKSPSGDVWIREGITVQELARRMKQSTAVIKRTLRRVGHQVGTLSERISLDVAELAALEHGLNPKHQNNKREWRSRPPVVTIMGHVDHGKTTLLDSLRQTSVAASEPGGITQHIGAFRVKLKGDAVVTFIDTPGHALFSSLRQRGANVTDIVVLVVAADDGVMRQTMQSIEFARQARVPIVVAINKVDKKNADIERVKQDLLRHGIQLEQFGGDVQAVVISALKNANIDLLIESILAQAELLDLTSHVNKPAEGVIIESSLDKGKGPMATVLVQQGVLGVGDVIVAGSAWARIRQMVDDGGKVVRKAGVSMPARVSGWRGLPQAGECIVEVESEHEARDIAAGYTAEEVLKTRPILNSDDKGRLPLVIKADTQGSLEALAKSLSTYDQAEATMKIVSSGVGSVTDSDVDMAASAGGIVVGFNVKANAKSTLTLAEQKSVRLIFHKVIYHLLSNVKDELTARLPDQYKDVIVGEANVLQVYKLTGQRKAVVAGCRVKQGSLIHSQQYQFRIVRDEHVIYEGKRFF